jgi:hypothetical protein
MLAEMILVVEELGSVIKMKEFSCLALACLSLDLTLELVDMPNYSLIGTYYKDYIRSRGWAPDAIEQRPHIVVLDLALAWGSTLVYWMVNKDHSGTGCCTCHQWAQARGFVGTVETINEGWKNGEALLSTPPDSRQQGRITAFLAVARALGLDPAAGG